MGTVPERLLYETLKDLRFRSSEREAGISPLRLFCDKSSCISVEILPIVEGMLPLNWFLLKFRTERLCNLSRATGIWVSRLLLSRFNRTREDRLTKLEGKLPFRALLEKSSVLSLDSLPISAGIAPPIRLLLRDISSSSLNALKEAGMLPEKKL
ncbi:hypothetical protein CIPAW_01G302200 [Carya illinoinensis]|uniref:Uncharacterized protein n=1 Tax=Carya illinoinensis TaxID=32201 RepID=A0A8T1RUD7_CARIL|nr:hypothetical protein CIPAW_01G302200 [Carya illinoinensis]